jgi:hypothetical protein
MSPVRNTKSKGFAKLFIEICLATKCPNGANVPISPKTAMFTSSNSVFLEGGALKYLTSEKV